MELNFLESLLFGLVSGLADILPVSAQAHKTIMLTIFGGDNEPTVLRLLIHLAMLGALYTCCRPQIVRISRQLKLARIPKKRRKRPLDVRTLMDFRLLQTAVIPVVICFVFQQKTAFMSLSLSWTALFMLINAALLFMPLLLPTGNKDSRSMSRVEALLMGLGGGLGVFPGVSSMGAMTSVASVCGADRTYALNISLLLNMAITVMLIFFDILAIVTAGVGTLSFGILIAYLLAAAAAFVGVVLGVRIMRTLAVNTGFSLFSWYCLAVALLSFVLYLML